MLTIVFQMGREVTWNVNDKNPTTIENVKAISHIIADGDERRLITGNNEGIPLCKTGMSTYWYGDHAQFIVANSIIK